MGPEIVLIYAYGNQFTSVEYFLCPYSLSYMSEFGREMICMVTLIICVFVCVCV